MNKINRREWMKSTALFSGGLALSSIPFYKVFAEHAGNDVEPMGIKEVHLVNLSHHDYGYTDLPSSVWDYQVNNIRLAMSFVEATRAYDIDSQFRWTVEGLWGLEKFWQDASTHEKTIFEKCVNSGNIEVTAMPGNMTCLVDAYEWEKELDRLNFFYQKFKPTVALQDDVNGLPWGMIESLLNRNVKYITMAANAYKGGKPIPAPSFFWWEGASQKKILMYNGEGYANGYDYFHTKEWRKGPVPNRYDVWFNPPSGNEIFSARKEDLLKAQILLNRKLTDLIKQGYSLPAVQLTFTNMWTIDNDLPCRQLSEFVNAWNELELQPKLVLSTPSRFIEKVKPAISTKVTTLRGEWCDWWADGIAASPVEVALLQDAKRRNKDIGTAQVYFDVSTPTIKKQIQDLNHELVFATEHTWGAYDSVAHPYHARTLGNHMQKFDYFFRADENSKRIQGEIIRESKNYKPFSQTNFLEVINPGRQIRSGWAEISSVAMRTQANAVKDLHTNKIYPFEETLSSEWNFDETLTPKASAEIPNDVWPFQAGKYRFFLNDIKPGERRKFQLTNNNKAKSIVTNSQFFEPQLDATTGIIKNVLYRPLNKKIFDEAATYLPAQLVVERPQGKNVRDVIAERKLDPKNIRYSTPQVMNKEKPESVYALRYKNVLQEDFAKRIEQQWDFFDVTPRIEITTTIWMKEYLDPLAVYIAFPFAAQSPRVFYDSMGSMVEVGIDQLPNTCGEYNTIQNGVSYKCRDMNIALTSLDIPMGIFDSIKRGIYRAVFKPQTGHFYSLVCQNYWITNFAVLKPAKLVIRHIIQCDGPDTNLLPVEGVELWGYPTNES